MGKKRVLVGYGIDVDAVANWINTTDGSHQDLTNVSRGVFGATVGVDRLLGLLDKYNIKASWFCPAHTIQSFPNQLQKVQDAGHEIGLHGYTHEYSSALSPSQQRDVLTKSVDILTQFCGKKPLGYTAPAWATSRELIPMLEEFGILYDHSFMYHDFQLHYAPDCSHSWIETNYAEQAKHWMKPMTKIKPSKVVDIPANWDLDDWPLLQVHPGGLYHGDVESVERLWKQQFDFAYREYDEFVFPMSIHPQVSGKSHVVLMHERIIEYINGHNGVEWMTFGDMAKDFLAGRIGGANIEGGVDV